MGRAHGAGLCGLQGSGGIVIRRVFSGLQVLEGGLAELIKPGIDYYPYDSTPQRNNGERSKEHDEDQNEVGEKDHAKQR